jgi:ParB-like chromosome segregation protein Spo0J
MQKLEIVYKNVDDLLPYINNARTHDEMQINQIASSIKEFGFNSPIAIDNDNVILCGHGRLLGAKKLGLKEVPTVCLSHLTPQEKKAYILADNKIALNSGWDFDLLKLEFEDLKSVDFDLELTGFNSEEIENILNSEDEDSEDEETSDDLDLNFLDGFSEKYNIVVECENQEEAEAFAKRFKPDLNLNSQKIKIKFKDLK